MKSVIWIWPDRSSARELAFDEEMYWKGYRETAAQVGMHMDVISPEDIDVICLPEAEPQVLVNGKQVSPADTMFVAMLYTFPSQVQDAWLLISTFETLKHTGFYLPISPDAGILTNEKMSTLLHFQRAGLKVLPTIRLTAGRDLNSHNFDLLLEQFSFPLVVKPASWASGMGLNIAHNRAELNSLLRLASAANLTMLLQPRLDTTHLIDYRAYCIDGRPYEVIARSPGAGEVVANVATGGKLEIVKLPQPLVEPITHIASSLGQPFACVDFLFDGHDFWFSEIELDGAIAAIELAYEPLREVLRERFRAYDRAHTRWLEQRSVH
jgi:glutathione synthase/RimK-type ligase-like ATP-grasp enzyme